MTKHRISIPRRIAGHLGYWLWRKRNQSAFTGRLYDLVEDFATGGNDRKKALLQWTYRETERGWGKYESSSEPAPMPDPPASENVVELPKRKDQPP